MKTWDEVRADWGNTELLKKGGRALFVIKALREMKCGIKKLASELKLTQAAVQQYIDYAGFIEGASPPSAGTDNQSPEVVAGDSNEDQAICKVVQKYKPDKDEVKSLKDEGYTDAVAKRLSRAKTAGRDADLIDLGNGEKFKLERRELLTNPVIEKGMRRNRMFRKVNTYIEISHAFTERYLAESDKRDCLDPCIPNRLEQVAELLLEHVNEWRAAIQEEEALDV